MKTILAPVDFSPVSDLIVKEAAALARAFDGRVVLLTVVQPAVVANEYAVMMNIEEITAAGEKNAARRLERFEELLRNQFIRTESFQTTGAPVPCIVEAAEKHEADYIVMGSHGHTALYDLLVGTTTHGVLMRTKCPVLIVPAVKSGSKPPKKRQRATAA